MHIPQDFIHFNQNSITLNNMYTLFYFYNLLIYSFIHFNIHLSIKFYLFIFYFELVFTNFLFEHFYFTLTWGLHPTTTQFYQSTSSTN